MFDNLKNLASLPGLMSKAREMQDKMKSLQEELANRQVTSDSGDGRVTATVNGRMELLSLHIDSTKLDTGNVSLVQDLVVAAVVSAQAQAAKMMRDEMQKMASELGLPPGMLP